MQAVGYSLIIEFTKFNGKKKSIITSYGLLFILATAINYCYGQEIPKFFQLYRDGNSYKEAGEL